MTDWHVLQFFSQSQPRKISVLRQILTNRRTGSTLYWGLRYHYLNYLNCQPHLDVQHFEHDISGLIRQGLLLKENQGLLLTDRGKQVSMSKATDYSFSRYPELNQKYDYLLWQSILLLMVQVASESSYHNSNYYVASSNLKGQFFIKNWLQIYGIKKLVSEISSALTNFLGYLNNTKADLFAAKLVGHMKNGMSDQQIADLLKISPVEVQITWKDLGLQFADYLFKHQEFSINQLVRVTVLPGILTPTIQKTAALFNQGKKVSEIMQIRRLRQSTIEEHLQILAILQPNFPFDRILSNQDIKILERVFEGAPIDQWHFDQLKQRNYSFSFLKFRLFAIMKTHDENDE